MSKQKTTRSLTIEIEPAQYEAVKKFADSEERSMSYVARKALKAFLGTIEFDNVASQSRGPGGSNPLADSTRSPQGIKTQF